MAQQIYRLVYVSTAQPALGDGDIEAILNTSQSNNNERYITGYLVHNPPYFMQVLEGPEDEVRDTFDRIRSDGRHSGAIQVMGERVQARAFPAWSMNYYRVDVPGGTGKMLVRRDDPVDSLMTADAPRDLIYLFSRFIQAK